MKGPTALVCALLIPLATARPALTADYPVDQERSELVVRLYKAGMASGLAHDHVVRATKLTGTVSWDPQQPGAAAVEVRADARSLIVDEPATRARHGLEGELDGDDRDKVQQTMESAKQLDVQAYPDMTFRSTSVRQVDGGAVEVTGDLTLHGTTRTVRFITTPELAAGVLTATAEIDFLQSDFGIKPYSAMLGAVKNQDGARLLVRLVAVQAPTEDPGAGDPASPAS